jgi:2-haloacid dehalogenase
MSLTRRQLATVTAGAALTAFFAPIATAKEKTVNSSRAIAFDAFVIFDSRSILAMAKEMFGERGAELVTLWGTRQFEYSWLRVLSGRYADFWQVTGDALSFAAQSLKIGLPPERRSRLTQGFLQLKPWPGVMQGLASLRHAGFRLALLSNWTPQMLAGCIKTSALEGVFDFSLSTDLIKTYKPDPHAYAMAVEAFGLPVEEIAFAAFGGWDAFGAKSFGYRTFWFNPAGQPFEQLGERPDATGASFADLVSYIQS